MIMIRRKKKTIYNEEKKATEEKSEENSIYLFVGDVDIGGGGFLAVRCFSKRFSISIKTCGE